MTSNTRTHEGFTASAQEEEELDEREAAVGFDQAPEQAAMERFGSGGMARRPWTRQMLTVMWEQLRLLLQVIYCTSISVFQMFRFELHVRSTEETGQHLSTTENPTDSFLFSSLFDGDNGVMVGGSNPLSEFCSEVGDPFAGKSTAEALLSSLCTDDLCCGLVDDFVSAGKEEGIFLGFGSDWNVFVSSSDSSSSNEACRKRLTELTKTTVVKQDSSAEDRSSDCSSEEGQSTVTFDSEALWESLSKSSDPYNPFFFSAWISTNTSMGKSTGQGRDSGDTDIVSVSKTSEKTSGPPGLKVWVSRSDSESSWASSDDSSSDVDKEESERLWEFFSSPADPYNPMCFTACTVGNTSARTPSTTVSNAQASLPAPPSKSDTDEDSGPSPSSEEDEDEKLWNSLCQKNDLNFQACLQSSTATAAQSEVHHTENPPMKSKKCDEDSKTGHKSSCKPPLADRQVKPHSHQDKTLVPWKRPGHTPQSPPEERKESKARPRKVRFSPHVHVRVMRTWLFAHKASRQGHWEEVARDRARFQRRIEETEWTIHRCLTQPHRERAYRSHTKRRTTITSRVLFHLPHL